MATYGCCKSPTVYSHNWPVFISATRALLLLNIPSSNRFSPSFKSINCAKAVGTSHCGHRRKRCNNTRCLAYRWDEEEAGTETEGASFEVGVFLFNAREYYRCHDVLENLWNQAEEPQRTLLHGILQCSVGFYHLFNQMEAILQDQSGKGQISNIEALNIRLDTQVKQDSHGELSQVPSAFKQFSMAQKEKTLEGLVKNQWLCTTEEGKLGLGIRAFLELRTLFKNFDVPFCDVCNEAGVKAQLCQNEDCSVRIHEYCVRRKFKHQQAVRVCPSCGTDWDCSGLNIEEPERSETIPSQEDLRMSHAEKRPRKSFRALRRIKQQLDKDTQKGLH